MPNKIVKVKNIETGDIFEAGIEWYNCNRRTHELYNVQDTVVELYPQVEESQENLLEIVEDLVEEVEEVVAKVKKTRNKK